MLLYREKEGMVRKEKILIVEDEKNIAKLIRYNLEKEGYDCTHTGNGEDALKRLGKEAFDLVLLDIMLPGIDGFEVCKSIRQASSTKNIPVIILTAKGEEVDRIVGFQLGADDYIPKPFSTRELLLRIRAVLKRGMGRPEEKKELLQIEDIAVNIPEHSVTAKGKRIEFTKMEFLLLVTLMQRRGRVQSRDVLLSDVWEFETAAESRTVDTHIKRIREKLGKCGRLLETVRGVGYRFKESYEN